jgi:hypothetical protein
LRRDWIYSSNPEPAASSFDMSNEDWEEEENEVMGFSSKSVLDGANTMIHHEF